MCGYMLSIEDSGKKELGNTKKSEAWGWTLPCLISFHERCELSHPPGPVLACLMVWSTGWQWATWTSPPPSGNECPTCLWQARASRTRRSRSAAVREGIFPCVQRPTRILISYSKLCRHRHLRKGNPRKRYWVIGLPKSSQLGFKKSWSVA